MKVYVVMLAKDRENVVFGLFDSKEKAISIKNKHSQYNLYIEECELNELTEESKEMVFRCCDNCINKNEEYPCIICIENSFFEKDDV